MPLYQRALLLNGRPGGQTADGGTGPSENLTFSSTRSSTKGKIILGSSSAYDEANVRLGINTTSPSFDLSFGTGANRTLQIETASSGNGNSLTISAGQAGAASIGGDLTLQGGNKGSGFSAGGAVFIDGGTTSALAGSVVNIGTGTGTGVINVGKSTSTIGFFGATSVAKPASTDDLKTALINLGLYTTGGASPLNLNGGALTVGSIAATGTVALTDTLTITDAKNIVVGSTTGTKIGTATTQKLGFFNSTPIVQPSSTTDLRVALINLGLYATGGATPLDLNGGTFVADRMALGGSSISAGFLINGDVTDAVTTRAFSSTLTYSGAGAAMRALSFTATYAGSSSTGSPSGALVTANLGIAVSGNSSITAVLGTGQITAAQSAGTKTVRGLSGFAQDTSAAHSGGTVNAASVVGQSPSAFTGFSTINRWAGLFDDDVQISTGGKLILEGGLTTKGDSYLVFDTTTANKIQVAIDNAVAIDFRAATMNFADPYNIVLGTTTGTKIGTATSQKLGFYNVTPIVQYSTTGTATGFTAGAGTTVTHLSTFTGNTGATAYTIGDIVRAMKLMGLMAA